jgi:hypothetical protein
MIQSQILSLLHARPFAPFKLHTAGGRVVDVSHPEACAYRGGRIMAVIRPDGVAEILDVFLIPHVEASGVPANGEEPAQEGEGSSQPA